MDKKISFLIILILSSIPSLVGPIANIGQWSGSNSPYLSQILTGFPTLLFGTWIGYKFIFLIGINKNVRSKSSSVMKSLTIFLFTFLACLASWSICQEILLVLQKAFGMIEAINCGWFDGIIGLPLLMIYSFVPCLIAAFLNGVISFIVFKRPKANHNNI
ncbi:hypothetical protein RXV94_06815 [Yeosuana sp. MJ-SS3]|uniref:DUF2798 domain-containing protein n=1 Tax=Gilvirhabdus luticola TaxID=3079858 RepID=A0ABU3U6B5_9FLAO|nr:hypothetical protein [Yeosuana sp. MJ-SS3]MDU8885867.1 hypothetical protein [Yeosuana sp. MJ-SS3]